MKAVLLISLIFVLQLNDACAQRKWPHGFDVFDLFEVEPFRFMRTEVEVPTLLSNFEKLLIGMKNSISLEKSPIVKQIQNALKSQKNSEDYGLHSKKVKRHIFNDIKETVKHPTVAIVAVAKDVKNVITKGGQEVVVNINKTINTVTTTVHNISRKFGDVLNAMKPEIRAIFPGTRWCGDGDIAKDYDDLGLFKSTDTCCRQHDKCPFGIGANMKYGPMNNIGLFTRSACFCDREFYDCLKNASNPIATKIGFTYFTILGPQCITLDHPAISCAKNEGLLDKKCVEYNIDDSQYKILQWNNSPDF